MFDCYKHMRNSAWEARSPKVALTQYEEKFPCWGIKLHLHRSTSLNSGSMLCSSSSLGEAKPLLQDKKRKVTFKRMNTNPHTWCLPRIVKSTGMCKSKAAGHCSPASHMLRPQSTTEKTRCSQWPQCLITPKITRSALPAYCSAPAASNDRAVVLLFSIK